MSIPRASLQCLVVLGLLFVVAPDEGRTQECPPDLIVQQVELWGLTRDRLPQRKPVDVLHRPPTYWQDSLWVEVVLRNQGHEPLSAVGVYGAARGVMGPVLYKEEFGVVFPDERRSLAQGVPFPSPIFLQEVLEEVPSGETRVVLGPFRWQDAFPWMHQSSWHGLPVAVDVEVAALLFLDTGSEQCVDDIGNNTGRTRVRLLNLY